MHDIYFILLMARLRLGFGKEFLQNEADRSILTSKFVLVFVTRQVNTTKTKNSILPSLPYLTLKKQCHISRIIFFPFFLPFYKLLIDSV